MYNKDPLDVALRYIYRVEIRFLGPKLPTDLCEGLGSKMSIFRGNAHNSVNKIGKNLNIFLFYTLLHPLRS